MFVKQTNNRTENVSHQTIYINLLNKNNSFSWTANEKKAIILSPRTKLSSSQLKVGGKTTTQ